MLIAENIFDPLPVWNTIKSSLVDQDEELETQGQFIGVFDVVSCETELTDDRMVGAFLVKPWSSYCVEIHGGIHRNSYGRGPEICKQLGLSIFKGTPILKIVCIVPEFNRLMIKCLKKIGMHKEGVIKDAFLKNMRLHDLNIYGINRMEVPECHPQSY